MATPISTDTASCGSCTRPRERGGQETLLRRIPVLRIERLSKSFGGARALDEVALHGAPRRSARSARAERLRQIDADQDPVRLPRARSGRPTIEIDGRDLPLRSRLGALRAHGVSFVHQHLGLMPSLTVLENLLLSDLAIADRWVDRLARRGAARARIVCALRHQARPADTASRSLSPVERAQLAIVRAFDELAAANARWRRRQRSAWCSTSRRRFCRRMTSMCCSGWSATSSRDGASVIFVSHDIDEVLEITNRATVLRDGRVAGTFETAGDVTSGRSSG